MRKSSTRARAHTHRRAGPQTDLQAPEKLAVQVLRGKMVLLRGPGWAGTDHSPFHSAEASCTVIQPSAASAAAEEGREKEVEGVRFGGSPYGPT